MMDEEPVSCVAGEMMDEEPVSCVAGEMMDEEPVSCVTEMGIMEMQKTSKKISENKVKIKLK